MERRVAGIRTTVGLLSMRLHPANKVALNYETACSVPAVYVTRPAEYIPILVYLEPRLPSPPPDIWTRTRICIPVCSSIYLFIYTSEPLSRIRK